jgi:hypothetical protein
MTSPTFTRAQLLSVQTLANAVIELKTQLSGTGIQGITDWGPGTYQSDLLQLIGTFTVGVQGRIAQMTLAACEPTASGSFLDAISISHFDNYRLTGTQTVGNVVCTLASGANTVTSNPGDMTLVFNGQYQFTNLTSLTLAAGQSGIFAFQAIAPGSAYNTANNVTPSALPSIAGLTFQNPASAPLTTWYTTPGVDTQSDASLHLLNETKWSTLAIGAPTSDRYVYTVISASAGVLSDVVVDGSNPNGPGTVNVYVSSPTAVGTSTQIAAISGSVQQIDFNGSELVQVLAPVAVQFGTTVNTVMTVYYAPGTDPGALADLISTALEGWIASIPTGGDTFGGGTNSTNFADINDAVALLYQIAGVRQVFIQDQSNIALSNGAGGIFQKLVVPTAGFVAPLLQLIASVR